MIETLNVIVNAATLVALIFGGIKIYYVLSEFPPHMHTERDDAETLTTDGVRYPRGTKNGNG